MDELRAFLRLALTRGVGPRLAARLLERFASAGAIARASTAELEEIEGIGRATSQAIRAGASDEQIDAELAAAARVGAQLIAITDPRYPPLLRMIPDPPPLLYLRGEVKLDDVYSVALVGSRRCSAYGRDQAGRLAAGLAQHGFTIISGGARGIDTEAHRGAMRVVGRTIAVLGSGLAHPYPAENEPLFDLIADGRGAVISEFPMDTRPAKELFPRRNRLISGLALGTLLVEASEHSGALITARSACEDHNRDVMALPGRVDQPNSVGCHQIIREGWAKLITRVDDVIDALDGAQHLVDAARRSVGERPGEFPAIAPDGRARRGGPVRAADSTAGAAAGPTMNPQSGGSPSPPPVDFTPIQKRIVEALDGKPVEFDELAARTGIDIAKLQANLTILEIRGVIARSPSMGVSRASQP